MRKYTTTVEVELEITFEYDVENPEPDVGIFDQSFAIWIDSIKGFRPTLQMQSPLFHGLGLPGHAWDKNGSTDAKVILAPWLQFDPALETAILAQVEDQIRDDYNEGE